MENQPSAASNKTVQKPIVIPEMFTRALKRKATDVLHVAQQVVEASNGVNVESVKSDQAAEKGQTEPSKEKKEPEKLEQPTEKKIKVDTTPTTLSVPKDVPFAFNRLFIEPKWKAVLGMEFNAPYMRELEAKLAKLYEEKTIFPPKHEIFTAFHLTPFNAVKVVIIGQDPYHGLNQAHGLSFSVKKGVYPPPSLINIYKELLNDHPGFVQPQHGYLAEWAKQGVFMLNAALTVEAHKANSHAAFGWHRFTDNVIKALSNGRKDIVFLLWGRFAQDKSRLIDGKKHCIIKTPHPSPLSAHNGWFGSGCFSKANNYLKSKNIKPIDWARL